MENSDNSNLDVSFLEDRLWAAYALIDTRRRRSFYFLFSSTAIFGLLWASKPSTFRLPFLSTEVDFFLAMAIAPAFILISAVSYFYLCAHTIHSYIAFLQNYQMSHGSELKKLGISFNRLHALLKQKDVTESLNIFMFPHRESIDWDASIHRLIKPVAGLIISLLMILTVVLPVTAYVGITLWISENYANHLPISIGRGLVLFYALMTSGFVSGPVYFYFRVKPSRRIYLEKIWGKN